MDVAGRRLILCGGLQSSGSTLISWCFLQRPDTDGFLDAGGDCLPEIPSAISSPYVWCKLTNSCFRFVEVMEHLQDQGWQVRPLLVVRDVRSVFNSLVNKHYGSNGITAEEPPLRMRLRRFKRDWELFKAEGWPIIRYESCVTEAKPTLRRACEQLGLAWSDDMLTWPKARDQISKPVHGNATFRESRGDSFASTVKSQLADIRVDQIPPGDLEWMEREFTDFNEAMKYPRHVQRKAPWDRAFHVAEARFENTTRHRRDIKRRKYRLLATAVGVVVVLVVVGLLLIDARP